MAVRSNDGGGGPSVQLMNESGEVTSHLQGMWYRTLKFIESGIKPVYVFDGKPPELKSGQLAKRSAIKADAAVKLEAAEEAGNVEDVDRFSKRMVKMDSGHIQDCQRLLKLMGMPVVQAPSEAEAQCAALAAAGRVYAAASEDMDTLTFGTPRLVRKLWAAEAAKIPVMEIDLAKALAALELTHDQFVDVCILAGCDYAEPIKGIAATTAYKLVKKEGSLAKVVAGLDPEKHPVPKDNDYERVRELFLHPEVTPAEEIDLKWVDPDKDGIMKFLVEEKGFSATRVEAGIAKLLKARGSGQQMRMDAFFKPAPAPVGPAAAGGGAPAGGGGAAKRKGDKDKGKDASKRKK